MKKIFLALGILSCFFVAAQQNQITDKQKEILEQLKTSNPSIKIKKVTINNSPVILNLTFPQAKLSHNLPNGNKVYILPQDNMPCIIPNLNHYNMPEASIQKDFAIKIPNAITPYKIIPDVEKTPYQIFLKKKSDPE